ncbi:hypothetical protein OIU79_012459 [Salix purpurea]|uniref:Uncharacterized protein n=1 Tax=Salix purpurea TaxID=77065 RepID=A0A9Q0T2R2_SALPP|nr:hypothetical protein OIU79_012459 [Salix purpurea]
MVIILTAANAICSRDSSVEIVCKQGLLAWYPNMKLCEPCQFLIYLICNTEGMGSMYLKPWKTRIDYALSVVSFATYQVWATGQLHSISYKPGAENTANEVSAKRSLPFSDMKAVSEEFPQFIDKTTEQLENQFLSSRNLAKEGKLPESRGQDDAEILVENEKNSDVKPAVNGVVRLKHED